MIPSTNSGKIMITDEELMQKIRVVLENYSGLSGQLSSAIGLVVMGHLMGWRFARLVLSRQSWKLATQLFGDLKQFLPEETVYSRKSVGLSLIKNIADFWAYVKGTKDALPLEDKNLLVK
jgi:hypothetical protein